MNGACWTSFAQALENDYDVIMPDARGHGNSSAPKQGYSYEILATDVLNFIEALQLNNPVLLGHSMGGMTAAVAASYTLKPLRGLILVDPPFLTPKRQREVYKSDIKLKHCQILNQSKESFLEQLKIRHPRRSPELIEILANARFQTSPYAFDILTPPNPNYRKLINSLTIPTLFIIGGTGGIVSPAVAAKLAHLNPHLKVVQIAQTGHAIPYDEPDHFANTVRDFLHILC